MDHSLFIHQKFGMLMVVFVDDIKMVGPQVEDIDRHAKALAQQSVTSALSS